MPTDVRSSHPTVTAVRAAARSQPAQPQLLNSTGPLRWRRVLQHDLAQRREAAHIQPRLQQVAGLVARVGRIHDDAAVRGASGGTARGRVRPCAA